MSHPFRFLVFVFIYLYAAHYIPFSRTVEYGRHSIQFEGARVWNHVPNKIRCALASLKKNYFKHGEDVTMPFVPAILVTPCFTLGYFILPCLTLF